MKKHFVLVHGAGHGAWCWCKLKTLLTIAGHRVTVPDLMGFQIDPNRLDDVQSVYDHYRPLMDIMASLDPHEKVILVGHSLGGLGVSLAMEAYPDRISVAVFATAVMPAVATPPVAVIREFFTRLEDPMDCQFTFDHTGPGELPSSVLMGINFLSSKLYQRCQIEDLTLAGMLIRRSGFFLEDISKDNLISEDKYGSVDRVYIISKEDELMNEDYQRWNIIKNPTEEVMEIKGSDHMVMISKPKELCFSLLEVADKYS